VLTSAKGVKPHKVQRESLTFLGTLARSQKLLNDHGLQVYSLRTSTSPHHFHASTSALLVEQGFLNPVLRKIFKSFFFLQDSCFAGNAVIIEN